tara:strand:+ start:405 stop:752 length:348 start_codon:yes stop_codon:yes gene_type:complete
MNKYYLILILAVFLTSISQVMFKTLSNKYQSNPFEVIYSPWIYLSIFIYSIAFVAWFISAGYIQFSVMMGVHVLTLVFGIIFGLIFFSEVITFYKLLAVFFISLGIIIMILDAEK